MVNGRNWNEAKQWVDTGRLLENGDEQTWQQGESDGKSAAVADKKYYRHTPYFVRTDLMEHLRHMLQTTGSKLSDPLETWTRPIDVTHLWPAPVVVASWFQSWLPSWMPLSWSANTGVNTIYSNVRYAVSRNLEQLGREQPQWRIFVGLTGSAQEAGRKGVDEAYIQALLQTKIMVITQRDGWEDHYRLFEGLVSGAMVMTDRMLSKPRGIRNGTELIEFTSLDDMRQKIDYYLRHDDARLTIARQGRLVALTRHRTWHRIEEMIFGDPVTQCSTVNNPD